ncbi:MAG: globin domain-containing protein [Candidatus Obscuribacterales bacterium]|jgi:hemoglobin-like flavoprotein
MSLNVGLLRETFARVKTENGGATALGMSFYKRLFEKYPAVIPLFHTPPEEQHKKLIASLGAIVGGVEQPERLLPYLHAMGIRHLKYKTETAHYGAVAENLLAVLAEHLGKEGEWTSEMQETWSAAIAVVAKTMIEAADNPLAYKDELTQMGYEPDGFRKNDSQPWVEKSVVAK